MRARSGRRSSPCTITPEFERDARHLTFPNLYPLGFDEFATGKLRGLRLVPENKGAASTTSCGWRASSSSGNPASLDSFTRLVGSSVPGKSSKAGFFSTHCAAATPKHVTSTKLRICSIASASETGGQPITSRGAQSSIVVGLNAVNAARSPFWSPYVPGDRATG